MWTTNGTQADWMCLLANTSDDFPHKNKSLICLPMNLPGKNVRKNTKLLVKSCLSSKESMLTFYHTSAGVHVARKIDKIGMWSSDTAEVFFDDVRVPCKNVIGQEGMGFTYQMLQFQEERLWGVANSKKSFLTPTHPTARQTLLFAVGIGTGMTSVFNVSGACLCTINLDHSPLRPKCVYR